MLRLDCIIGFLSQSWGQEIKQTKSYSLEVKLNVPFEPNLGNTCFSSSFAMVMRYWRKDIHVNDVLKVFGRPPFSGYEHPELNRWMRRNHGLGFRYLPNSSIDELKLYLNEGYPIIVHQIVSQANNDGHNRVVIGYSDKKGVFITNDPSKFGPDYEISYEVFRNLWRDISLHEKGSPNKAYLVMPMEN